jgi:hypothetical protein
MAAPSNETSRTNMIIVTAVLVGGALLLIGWLTHFPW